MSMIYRKRIVAFDVLRALRSSWMAVGAVLDCLIGKTTGLNDLNGTPPSMPHTTKRKPASSVNVNKTVFKPGSVTEVSATRHKSAYPTMRRVSVLRLTLARNQRYSSSRIKHSASEIHTQRRLR